MMISESHISRLRWFSGLLFEHSSHLALRAKQCFAFPRSPNLYIQLSKQSHLSDPTFLVAYRDGHSDRTILDQNSQPFGPYATTDLYHSHNHVPIVVFDADGGMLLIPSLVQPPQNGSLSGGHSQAFYIPNPNYFGLEQII